MDCWSRIVFPAEHGLWDLHCRIGMVRSGRRNQLHVNYGMMGDKFVARQARQVRNYRDREGLQGLQGLLCRCKRSRACSTPASGAARGLKLPPAQAPASAACLERAPRPRRRPGGGRVPEDLRRGDSRSTRLGCRSPATRNCGRWRRGGLRVDCLGRSGMLRVVSMEATALGAADDARVQGRAEECVCESLPLLPPQPQLHINAHALIHTLHVFYCTRTVLAALEMSIQHNG